MPSCMAFSANNILLIRKNAKSLGFWCGMKLLFFWPAEKQKRILVWRDKEISLRDKDRTCNWRGRIKNTRQPSSWHWPLPWPTVTRGSAFKLLNCKLEPWHFRASVQRCYLRREWQFAKRNQEQILSAFLNKAETTRSLIITFSQNYTK